jgi:hypothetical protein
MFDLGVVNKLCKEQLHSWTQLQCITGQFLLSGSHSAMQTLALDQPKSHQKWEIAKLCCALLQTTLYKCWLPGLGFVSTDLLMSQIGSNLRSLNQTPLDLVIMTNQSTAFRPHVSNWFYLAILSITPSETYPNPPWNECLWSNAIWSSKTRSDPSLPTVF